jgi:hypothetical protein
MKKIYTFVMSVLAAAVMSAQTPVTFTVDISGAGLTPSADGVFIAGNFADPNNDGSVVNPGLINWSPGDSPNSIALTEVGGAGSGVYSVTLNLMPETYNFKFINGIGWGNVESVPAACGFGGDLNREIVVGATPGNYMVCFGACIPCGTGTVTFKVDMSMVDADGDGIFAEPGVDISPNGVHIAGSFNNFSPTATECLPIGNGVYAVTLPLAYGDYEFKFINGNTWGFEESVPASCGVGNNLNRIIGVSAPVVSTINYCFGSCSTCMLPTPVTFRVNLSLQTPSANGVHIAGSFADNGNPYPSWNPGVIELLPTADPNIFEVTLNLAQGNYQYKFINGNAWGSDESIPADCNVGGNRGVTVGATAMTEEYCFTQCSQGCIQDPNPANLTFQVDMASMIAIAAFNPAVDTLWMISGATTPQWQAGKTVMTDADGDQVYECTKLLSGPGAIQYKYLTGADVTAPILEEGAGIDSTGCGIDNGVGGWNRTFIRSGNDEATGVYCFDQCTDCDGNPVIGVDEVALNNNVQVYPNPTEGVLNIAVQIANTQDVKVEVYNAMGQFIMVEKFNKVAAGKNTLGLNLNNVPTGLYIVEVTGAHLNETFRVAVK